MFAKALGTQQNKKKSIVMLKAVLGIVPRSVAFLPACRWAFSCSCNLRRAQQHSVIAWAFLVLVIQLLQFPK